MIGRTLVALGAYRFAVASGGVGSVDRTTEWRWASQEVIGAPPALQYIGPGEDKVTLKGIIFPHYRGGLGQVDAMRAQAGRGQPLTLVDGTGRYYGVWVITSIGEEKSFLFADGAPRRIEFTVEIKRYA